MSCLLSVVRSFTGDCTNSSIGAINVEITGSAPDYTIQWVQPSSYGVISLGVGVTGYTQTGLSGGTFIFNVIDTCSPDNTVLPVSFYISTGTCVSITSTQDTTCNSNNGILTASTANLYNETASFYLYNNSLGYVTSGFSYTNEYIFTNLSPGTYYVIGDDGGGCTGKSETCIVKPSTELDFGFFVVNNSNCGNGNTGKLYVTGLTGNAPYYYLWSNGTIDDYLTGLTSGNYSVTITDSSGCIVNKSVNVNDVPLIGLLSLSTINPDCFIANGSATINITGGAAPYFFSGSNGYSEVSYSTSYTFNNLGSGNFIVSVTDAGLCNFTTNTSLISPQGFSVVNVGINNSTCNNSSGSLSPIILIGPNQPYVYSLTYPSGYIMSSTTTSTFWQYTNLSSGTYTLSISGGTCLYTQQYVINNTVVYTLSATTTPSTCDRINGSVLLEISQGGVAPYTFTITGKPPIQTSFSSVTFNNLLSDTYTVTVIDSNGCAQTDTIIINSSPTVDFVLNKNDATTGSNGSIQTYITSGTPPFTYLWSNGQTTPNISGLNDGDYTLKVTDINGCVKQRTITINGYDKISSYQSYTICDDIFADGGNVKKGIKQMYVEGYFDSISDDYNCVLDSATFIAQVAVGNEINSFPFYISNSLTDYPLDNEWFEFVKSILQGYPNIGEVIIDYVGNTITINTNCDPESLFNTNVIVRLRIEYIISCEKCNLSCDIDYIQIITPTPTPTPTSIPDCSYVLLLDINGYVLKYDTLTNTYTTLFDSQAGLDLAHSNDKLWINSATNIREYNITLSPWSQTFNRNISTGSVQTGNALGKPPGSNNKLVVVDVSRSPSVIVELDITNSPATSVDIATLPAGGVTPGDLLITDTIQPKILINLIYVTSGADGLYQYDYNTGAFEIYVPLGSAASAYGIYEEGNSIYLVTAAGLTYSLLPTSPYTVTYVQTIPIISPVTYVVGASQLSECTKIILTL